MREKDEQIEAWRQWGVARAQENWARCVRCLAVPPVDGKRYCADCLLLPRVVWRHPTWNGFAGHPNPLPWRMLRVPYEKDGVWEEWMEYEHWTPLTRWQAWWNKQKMALGRIKWPFTRTQPGWDDERPD